MKFYIKECLFVKIETYNYIKPFHVITNQYTNEKKDGISKMFFNKLYAF